MGREEWGSELGYTMLVAGWRFGVSPRSLMLGDRGPGPMATEADTCRTYILPKLHAAGWEDDLITEQLVQLRMLAKKYVAEALNTFVLKLRQYRELLVRTAAAQMGNLGEIS